MIKIETEKIKSFISLSKQIKNLGTSLGEQYVRMVCEGGKVFLTRTNGESFVTQEIEAKFQKDATLFIDERILSDSVSTSSAKEIKITHKIVSDNSESGKTVMITIKDDDLINATFPSIEAKLFPQIPEIKRESSIVFTPAQIEALFLSSQCTMPIKGVEVYQNMVHIRPIKKGQSYICGFANSAMYFKYFKANLPEVVLQANVAAMLSAYPDGVTFSSNDNYNFFDAGTVLFGFAQTVLKGPEFLQVINMMDSDRSFTIERQKLLDWCKYAIRINKSTLAEPVYLKNSDVDKTIELNYDSIGFNVSAIAHIDIKKSKRFVIPKFVFVPTDMVKCIEKLPYEKITFTGPCNKNYYVTTEEDADYVGVVRELVLPGNETEQNTTTE